MRTTILIAVSAAVLSACGGEPFHPVGACRPLNFFVQVEEERNCQTIDDAFVRARQLLVEEHSIIPPVEFDAFPHETMIWVHAAKTVDDDPWHDTYGSYNPGTEDIRLGRYLTGLVHEFEHHYQMTRLLDSEADARAHKRWSTDEDWKAADEQFQLEFGLSEDDF